jgi:hypothetical protein
MSGNYTLDSGQGRQSVERNLAVLNDTIAELQAELANAGGDGVFAITLRRSPS